MSGAYLLSIDSEYAPEPQENVMESLFKQYERVIVESLVTSFGLDFLIKDQFGGDVDTIHNVRQIGKDNEMTYKNEANQRAYHTEHDVDNLDNYRSNKAYRDKILTINEQKKADTLRDAYTGEKILRNEDCDLDHVISVKEIHDDRGRILAGLRGVDLANSDENLYPTNPHTNRTKSAKSIGEFLDSHGGEYTEEQKANMRTIDARARESYERKLARAYYTSPGFAKDVAFAAGAVGINMGLRQTLGFVFAEIWFSVKEELLKVEDGFALDELFLSIAEGIKVGFENARRKYKTLFDKFLQGAAAGTIASVTTTLCNIFVTTAKNTVRIIRQAYPSIIQAANVLYFNPDCLLFGERMRAAAKILAVGASVVAGVIVGEAVGKTGIGAIPMAGDAVQAFCGALVSGVMSCTFLFFLDRSGISNQLVDKLNDLHSISTEVNYFRKQAAFFEEYAAKIMEIDIDKFREETGAYHLLAIEIEKAESDGEVNSRLKEMSEKMGIKLPWQGDFGCFMCDPDSVLVFE